MAMSKTCARHVAITYTPTTLLLQSTGIVQAEENDCGLSLSVRFCGIASCWQNSAGDKTILMQWTESRKWDSNCPSFELSVPHGQSHAMELYVLMRLDKLVN